MMIRLAFLVLSLCLVDAASDVNTEGETGDREKPAADSSGSAYSHASVCSYCVYAKFCDLCEKDCPCQTSASKPNCHMCKYCRFCSLTTVCDTICRPGGFIDSITSALWGALPSWNKDEVDHDIETVKDYL